MKILALFAAVLLCGIVECQLGADKCTWGPSYWCSHIKHAKQCGAVDHCMSTAWTNQKKTTTKATPSCTFCKLLISNMRHVTKFTSDKSEQYNMMAKACTVLPGSLKQKCKDLVKNDLKEVMLLLDSDMDESAVCTLVGLCEKQEEPVKTSSEVIEKVEKVNNDDCADCKAFFKDVQDRVSNNKSLAQFESLIDSLVCAQLGPFENMCKQMINQYIVSISKYVHDQLNPGTICHLIDFCGTADFHDPMWLINAVKNLKKVQHSSPFDCQLCETAVTDARNLIREESVQKVLKNFIEDDLCILLGNLTPTCKKYVDAYAPLVFQLLANELDPKAVCSAVGFCNSTSSQPRLHHVALTSSVSNVRTFLPKATPPKKVTTGPACVLCEFIMKEIDHMIGSNKSAAAVESALDQVCDILPSTISEECKDFVATYGPAIIQLLVQEMDPQKICTAIGLCSASSVRVAAVKSDDEVCDICKEAMELIIQYLKQNATITQIKSLLEDLCNRLPETISKQCSSFVDQYIQLVLDLITQEYSPKQICAAMSLCKQNKINSTLYFLKAFRKRKPL